MSQASGSLSATSLLYCTRYPAMGTEYSLYTYARSREEADAIAEPVFQEVTRIEDLLSNYRESSELSRINREAAHGDVTTDPETFRFLQTCFEWSARSQGAFDITVGKLMKTWGFFGAKGSIPLAKQLDEAHTQVGWQKVQLDETRRTVRFLSAGIELDPGGIGKGYAVDRAIRVLRKRNISTALLSAGSSTIYALGAPAGEAGWKVRVPAPGEEDTTISTVILRDTSLSTANRSEKYFIHDGHVYGAIMDPRTLRPVEGILQTTVISRSATSSDALSNALFVLGTKNRAWLLDQVPEDSALVVLDNQSSARHEITRWTADIDNYSGAKLAQAEENQKI
jgi:thiamine biosynthesis lipoprotein